MLYTRKGDNGETKIFGCNQKLSKSSAIAEALGALDEINSFLGICKIKSKDFDFSVNKKTFEEIIHDIQKDLFLIQAEVAGADKKLEKNKIEEMEKVINAIEKELAPIKSFFISGGSELSAFFDIARTIARMAERRTVSVSEEGIVKINKNSLAYLNRLSSFLYAFARLTNHKFGITEESPDYK